MDRTLAIVCAALLVLFIINKVWLLAVAFGLAGFMFLSLHEIKRDLDYTKKVTATLLFSITGTPVPDELKKEILKK